MTDPYDPFGLVASVLERKYRVDRVTAEGGFGVVYRGHHLGLDVPIAIKILKSEAYVRGAGDDPDFAARFLQEGKTLARLRHPNIVAVLDTGITHTEARGQALPWIVFEWLEGETLDQDLARREGRGGRSPEDALALIRPLIEAMREAHDLGVAHRDLKPSNIMLARSARGVTPKVLDFGIAKLMAPAEVAGTGSTKTQGTLNAFSAPYASPEQLSGARTGPWTDVHALALILTEILIDEPPYAQGGPTELHAAVFSPDRPSPALFGVEVGPLEAVISRALSLKPSDRYQHAGELLDALTEAVGGKVDGPRRLAFADTARPALAGSAGEDAGADSEAPVIARQADVTLPDSVRQLAVTRRAPDDAAAAGGASADPRAAPDAEPAHGVTAPDADAAALVRGLRLRAALIALVSLLVLGAAVRWVQSFAEPRVTELPSPVGSDAAALVAPQTPSAGPEPPALAAARATSTAQPEAAQPSARAASRVAAPNSAVKLPSPSPAQPSASAPAPLVSSPQAPGSYALD